MKIIENSKKEARYKLDLLTNFVSWYEWVHIRVFFYVFVPMHRLGSMIKYVKYVLVMEMK